MSATIAEKLQAVRDAKGAIADAIAARGGSVPELLADYGEAILALPSDAPAAELGDVRFRDLDGRPVRSMTVSEARALESLPELPEHEGLVAKGWNFTLAELKAVRGVTEVAALYETDDGATRFHIEIGEDEDPSQPLVFEYTGTSATVDWGDGTPPETVGGYPSVYYGRYVRISHDYAPASFPAKYVISVKVSGGTAMSLGGISGLYETTGYHLFGEEYDESKTELYGRLRRIECGDCLVEIGPGSLRGCANLEAFVMSGRIAKIGPFAFRGCGSLGFFAFGRGIPEIGESALAEAGGIGNVSIAGNATKVGVNAFRGAGLDGELWIGDGVEIPLNCTNFENSSLKKIRLPLRGNSIGEHAFAGCGDLETLILPKHGGSYVGSFAFLNCVSLRELEIPEGITEIREHVFAGSGIAYLKMPSTIASVGLGAFDFAAGAGTVIDFRTARQVPEAEEGAVVNVGEIVVPDALYAEWCAADVWRSHAGRITKASEA